MDSNEVGKKDKLLIKLCISPR